jgi:site-specific DNA recombinase
MNTRQQTYNAGIYCRLSVDDPGIGDSGSIQTQKAMLADYCKQNGLNIVNYYTDDGFSGTNFNRPDFQRMISDIEAGAINTVVTKDLSRFGRDYVETGMYIEKYFVDKDVRFIAPSDNVDTFKNGFDIMVPFRNILNDVYARDVSKKTKAAFDTRARQGLFIASRAPFGYIKDPEDKHHLLVDEPAAEVVRRIFQMASEGAGYNRIAKLLHGEGVLNPIAYFNKNNPDYYKSDYWKKKSQWHVTSIQKILENQAYLGCVVHGRVGTKGIKGRRIKKSMEDWIVVENMHEPLISRNTWELVRSQLSKKRRERKDGTVQMFAGLLYCSDCGSALSFSTVKRKTMPDGGEYKCWYYMRHGKESCSSHYISYDSIKSIVLEDIRIQSRYAVHYSKKYLEHLRNLASEEEIKNLKKQQQQTEKMRKRIEELDIIIKKLLEQNALGSISNERFSSLSSGYEHEQQELKDQLAELNEKLAKAQSDAQNAERFLALIKKYTELPELNAKVLNELIHRIVIYQAQTDENGHRTQRVDIFYKFVGLVKMEVD